MVGDTVEMGGVLYFDCPEDILVARIEERGRLAVSTSHQHKQSLSVAPVVFLARLWAGCCGCLGDFACVFWLNFEKRLLVCS
jgi:hypothetical protein